MIDSHCNPIQAVFYTLLLQHNEKAHLWFSVSCLCISSPVRKIGIVWINYHRIKNGKDIVCEVLSTGVFRLYLVVMVLLHCFLFEALLKWGKQHLVSFHSLTISRGIFTSFLFSVVRENCMESKTNQLFFVSLTLSWFSCIIWRRLAFE